eukprot:762753-Pleurochrysis_carterae.AAC.2
MHCDARKARTMTYNSIDRGSRQTGQFGRRCLPDRAPRVQIPSHVEKVRYVTAVSWTAKHSDSHHEGRPSRSFRCYSLLCVQGGALQYMLICHDKPKKGTCLVLQRILLEWRLSSEGLQPVECLNLSTAPVALSQVLPPATRGSAACCAPAPPAKNQGPRAARLQSSAGRLRARKHCCKAAALPEATHKGSAASMHGCWRPPSA